MAKGMLEEEADRAIHNPEITSKLIGYKECVEVWNGVYKAGLSRARMPNLYLIRSPEIILFWETMQNAINDHYRNVHIKGWDRLCKTNMRVDDDRNHLIQKIPADNLQLNRHVRDNRVVLVNHYTVLTPNNMLIRTECEKHGDNATSTLHRLIKYLFSPSGN